MWTKPSLNFSRNFGGAEDLVLSILKFDKTRCGFLKFSSLKVLAFFRSFWPFSA